MASRPIRMGVWNPVGAVRAVFLTTNCTICVWHVHDEHPQDSASAVPPRVEQGRNGFEHLWKDNSVYVKRAKVHFKDTYRRYKDRATKQHAIETIDTEPQDNLEVNGDDLLQRYKNGRIVPDVGPGTSTAWYI